MKSYDSRDALLDDHHLALAENEGMWTDDCVSAFVYNADLVNGLRHLLTQARLVNVRRPETLDGNPEALRVAALALHVEIAELLQELNWKPWKQERPIDVMAAADELADVLIFTANLVSNVMGQTGLTLVDIAVAHANKTLVNIERTKGRVDGYGKE